MHFGPWGYAFVRAAPGLALEDAKVDDPSSPSSLEKSEWFFSADVSAGYAWLVGPRFQRSARTARLWLQGDVGYGWVEGNHLALAPSGGSQGQGAGVSGVDLGSLSVEGAFFRLAAAVSF